MSDGKRPLGFVNRRGHNSNFDSVDLSDLSIDAQPETAVKFDEPEAATANDKIRNKKTLYQKAATEPAVSVKPAHSIQPTKPTRRSRSRWTRRKTLILIVVILILAALPILGGELLRAQYLASTSSAKSSLKNIVTQDVLPLQKKTDITSNQVSAITSKLEGVRDSMCPGGMLDNLAALYPRANSAHSTCIDERGRIASLALEMRNMTDMLSYIESLNAALAPITAPSTDQFAVIANQQSSWQQASETLQKLDPPTQMQAAHAQLITAVKSITDGWSKLNVANNNQDAAGFQSAEKQLSDAYNAVRASRDSFAGAIAAEQASISTLSQNLN